MKVKTRPGALRRMTEFVQIYRLYRHCHSRRYAFTRAYEIALRGLPF